MIGFIIIHLCIHVAATGIYGALKIVSDFYTPVYLRHRIQNVEELTEIFFFCAEDGRVQLGKRGANEAGG